MKGPSLTEAEWQRQVTDLAELLGWSWVHFRPAQTSHGWRTPVSGPLGKGWPDLVLVHPDRGVIFAELKRDSRAVPSAEQLAVADRLKEAGALWVLWKPDSWPVIVDVLGGKLA